MTKKKFDLVFHVEIDQDDPNVLNDHLGTIRQSMRELMMQGVTGLRPRDIPNFEVRKTRGIYMKTEQTIPKLSVDKKSKIRKAFKELDPDEFKEWEIVSLSRSERMRLHECLLKEPGSP